MPLSDLPRIAVFVGLQLAVSLFAIRRGGSPERLVGWMLLAAAAATLIGGVPANRYHALDELHLGIDLLLFMGLMLVALRANRFWPLWVAAFQLIAIGVHGVRAIDPYLVPYAYYGLLGRIAYPICAALMLGTFHYLHRQRNEGRPPAAWAPLRW